MTSLLTSCRLWIIYRVLSGEYTEQATFHLLGAPADPLDSQTTLKASLHHSDSREMLEQVLGFGCASGWHFHVARRQIFDLSMEIILYSAWDQSAFAWRTARCQGGQLAGQSDPQPVQPTHHCFSFFISISYQGIFLTTSPKTGTCNRGKKLQRTSRILGTLLLETKQQRLLTLKISSPGEGTRCPAGLAIASGGVAAAACLPWLPSHTK